MSVSILILTKNEQTDLPDCLKTLSWCDDIYIFDSGSDDSTKEIAHDFKVNFFERKYDNPLPFGGDESAHRNWAIQNLPFKNEWILTIDADERVTEQLKCAIFKAISNNHGESAFRVQRRDFFLGTWLKHVQTTPYYIRLFKRNKLHYERLINPVTLVDGSVTDIPGYLDHFPFSKGIGHWLERHNGYSTGEAKQIIENRKTIGQFKLLGAFFERDFNKRRFHQKELFYRLPFRPLVKFVILFFLKRGFLDGRAGFTYAILQSIYEYMIVLKTREIENPDLHRSKNK